MPKQGPINRLIAQQIFYAELLQTSVQNFKQKMMILQGSKDHKMTNRTQIVIFTKKTKIKSEDFEKKGHLNIRFTC